MLWSLSFFARVYLSCVISNPLAESSYLYCSSAYFTSIRDLSDCNVYLKRHASRFAMWNCARMLAIVVYGLGLPSKLVSVIASVRTIKEQCHLLDAVKGNISCCWEHCIYPSLIRKIYSLRWIDCEFLDDQIWINYCRF